MTEAQKGFKKGSEAYNKLAGGLKTLGTKNDGNGLEVRAVSNSKDYAVARGGIDERTGNSTLTVNPNNVSSAALSAGQNYANLVASGAHELKHISDDQAAGSRPHDVATEIWHEVRGVRAETPVWQGLGVFDPWGTWTTTGGLNMNQVYKEAQTSTDMYCRGGQCP